MAVQELIGDRYELKETVGTGGMSTVYRAFDTAERLLRAVAAPQAEDLLKAKIAALSDSIDAARKLKVQQTTATAVAAEPRAGVRRAHHTEQSVCDGTEQVIAGRMSEPVVDRLDVVEIEKEYGWRSPAPRRARDRVIDAVAEQRAIREARQRIMERLVSELLFERTLRRDVAKVGLQRQTAVERRRH